MRAVVYSGPRRFEIVSVEDPVPGPGEVCLRTTIAGVCGTDLHIDQDGFFSRYPLTPGHEIVGEVEDIGPGVAGLRPGQVVAADNTVLCGKCYFCRRDEPLFCRDFYSLGVNGPGAFAEYVIVRAEKCFPAGDLPLETAVMTEPTACAVHGMDMLELRPGADVLLFGAGPTGLVLAQLLLHGGAARVTVAAPTPFKLELARSYGIHQTVEVDRHDTAASVERLMGLTKYGFDVVVDATGAEQVISLLPGLTRDGGTIFLYGMAGEAARVAWSPYEIFRRQLTIKGSFAQTHCFDRALAMLRSGLVRTDGMLTHRFPLPRYGDALDALRSGPTCLKAAILP